MHPTDDEMRAAVLLALDSRSPEKLAGEIQDISPNTVRGFAYGTKRTSHDTRAAIARWYFRRHPGGTNPQPTDAPAHGPEYWAGVLYAAEAMSATVTQLLREQRQAADQIAAAVAVEATRREAAPAPTPHRSSESARRGTGSAGRRTARRPGTAPTE